MVKERLSQYLSHSVNTLKKVIAKSPFSNKYSYKVSSSFTVCFINTILSTIWH